PPVSKNRTVIKYRVDDFQNGIFFCFNTYKKQTNKKNNAAIKKKPNTSNPLIIGMVMKSFMVFLL
ncbi:MAG: hypothetical protein WCH34_01850, partial [Bacteroidota bacterium]